MDRLSTITSLRSMSLLQDALRRLRYRILWNTLALTLTSGKPYTLVHLLVSLHRAGLRGYRTSRLWLLLVMAKEGYRIQICVT